MKAFKKKYENIKKQCVGMKFIMFIISDPSFLKKIWQLSDVKRIDIFFSEYLKFKSVLRTSNITSET